MQRWKQMGCIRTVAPMFEERTREIEKLKQCVQRERAEKEIKSHDKNEERSGEH